MKGYRITKFAVGAFFDKWKKKFAKNKRDYQKEVRKKEDEYYKFVWEKERKEYYLTTRDKFKQLCKEGRIRKQQQKDLIWLLERLIAGFMKDYRTMEFENEFHRIYTYLKCWHLDADDWERINKYLDKVQ